MHKLLTCVYCGVLEQWNSSIGISPICKYKGHLRYASNLKSNLDNKIKSRNFWDQQNFIKEINIKLLTYLLTGKYS